MGVFAPPLLQRRVIRRLRLLAVVDLLQPGSSAEPLTEVLRDGSAGLARPDAIEAEVAEFLASMLDLKTATGLSRVVRRGHLPEREVMTGIGPVGVRQPRVRDRGAADDAGRIRFTPRDPAAVRGARGAWRCWSRSFTFGISTGDFEEALAGGPARQDAPGLSASTVVG